VTEAETTAFSGVEMALDHRLGITIQLSTGYFKICCIIKAYRTSRLENQGISRVDIAQMAQETNIPEGHITLKEAARLSGYAPDYVGQLIRKGKLYGKQVYYNVAWVTTEAALKEYIAEENKGSEEAPAGTAWQRLVNALLSEARLTGLIKTFLYGALAVSVLLSLFLFYVLSVNLDRSLERKAVERALHAAP
jgi:hypothetical protein